MLKTKRVSPFTEEGSLMQAALGREALVIDVADRRFPMATSAGVNRGECRKEVSEVERMG